jgi:hypothetical protein
VDFKTLKNIGKYGALVFVMTSGLTYSLVQAEQAAQENTAGKVVIALLRAFEAENKNDTRTLRDFFTEIIKILEDPVKAEEFNKEYPNIDVKALIAALKKVQDKTSAVVIGTALKPFFEYLPADLRDIPKLWKAIKRRTVNKGK